MHAITVSSWSDTWDELKAWGMSKGGWGGRMSEKEIQIGNKRRKETKSERDRDAGIIVEDCKRKETIKLHLNTTSTHRGFSLV